MWTDYTVDEQNKIVVGFLRGDPSSGLFLYALLSCLNFHSFLAFSLSVDVLSWDFRSPLMTGKNRGRSVTGWVRTFCLRFFYGCERKYLNSFFE